MALHGLKRRRTIVAGLAVLAAAGTSLFGLPEADAQTNSRLCGRIWWNTTSQETVIRFYEVRKADSTTCSWAKEEHPLGRGVILAQDGPWKLKGPRNPGLTPDPAWPSDSIGLYVCEEFKKEYAKGRDWVYEGQGWPSVTDQNDICLNMNRSDTAFEMETYWLYDDGSHGTWQFRRG